MLLLGLGRLAEDGVEGARNLTPLYPSCETQPEQPEYMERSRKTCPIILTELTIYMFRFVFFLEIGTSNRLGASTFSQSLYLIV